MNILPALKQRLTEAGVTRTIKLNNFADAPKDQLIIRDTGEIEPDPEATYSTKIEHRTFQIIVRGGEYDATSDVCDQIRLALHNTRGTTAGIEFKSLSMFSGFQPITNEIGNYEFSGNFKCRVLEV